MTPGLFRAALTAGVFGVLSAAQIAPAGATTQTPQFSAPMTVTAVFGGSSTINVSPMNFGNVQTGGYGKNTAVATIVYQGPLGDTITIGPGLGNCSSAYRCMTDNADPNNVGVPTPTHTLLYQLYKDPGHQVVWGDGTAATGTATGVTTTAGGFGQPQVAGTQTLFVYGAILQVPGSGGAGATFTDTVMVTING